MQFATDYIIADLRSNCSYKGISTGHYIPVARMYQELLKDSGNIYVAGGPVYEASFRSECFIKLPYNVSGDSIAHKIRLFINSFYLFRKGKRKTIVLQQSSDVTTHLAIALFYWGGSRLFMIRYSCEGLNSIFKKLIYKLCKNKIDGIICPTQQVADVYERPHIIIPDYINIPSTNTVNASPSSYADKKYDFCMIGRIAKEKGIVEIAKELINHNYKTIIAGKPQSQELADELYNICKNHPQIELVLDYISEEQYNHYLRNSKYTILNYSGEYSERSSGVVFDTLFAGVPVIGCRCKALQFIETNEVGYIYNSSGELFRIGADGTCLYDTMFDENRHRLYIENIKKYKETHIIHAKNLTEFITKH